MFMYALVVIMNLNVLMSSDKLNRPIITFFTGQKVLTWSECISLYITMLLGSLNFVGYFVSSKVTPNDPTPDLIDSIHPNTTLASLAEQWRTSALPTFLCRSALWTTSGRGICER